MTVGLNFGRFCTNWLEENEWSPFDTLTNI